MKNLKARQQHNIVVFLDVDGYTAYYKEYPYISAGGDTEEEALRELAVAFELACENNKSVLLQESLLIENVYEFKGIGNHQ